MAEINNKDEIQVLELEKLCFRLFLEQHLDFDSATRVTEMGTMQHQDSKKGLPMNKRHEIATSLLGDIQHATLERKRDHSEKLDSFNVSLEEVNLRLVDLEKDAFSFKRDVVVKGKDGEGLDRINNERCLRYFQSRIICLESTLDRLYVQHADCKKKLNKLLVQSKQRGSGGTPIHFLDVHQLQIDTKKQSQRLNEQTNDLARVKIIVSKHFKYLLHLKDQLKKADKDLENVEKALLLRKKHSTKLNDEIEARNQKLKEIQCTSSQYKRKEIVEESTQICQMIQTQHDLGVLRSEVKHWKRKNDIATKT